MSWLSDVGDWLGGAWDSFTGLFDSSTPSQSTSNINFGVDGGNANFGLGDYLPSSNTSLDNVSNSSSSSSWWQNPSILSAAITSGAGLLQGMNNMNIEEQRLKASADQVKMNQMLELAKLKYQLMNKGAGTSRRGGSGSALAKQQLEAQLANNLASGYQNLGTNLASIYKG